MLLVLVDEETGQWISIPESRGFFFLGGMESDTVLYFNLRGWQEYDVQVHRLELGWGYQGRLLRQGDILQESGTSRLLVELVEGDRECASVVRDRNASTACRLLCRALESPGWGYGNTMIVQLAEVLSDGNADGTFRWRVRDRCETSIRSGASVVARAFAVSVLAKVARSDPHSVDILASLFADGTIHLDAFGALVADGNRTVAVEILRRLTDINPATASELRVRMHLVRLEIPHAR